MDISAQASIPLHIPSIGQIGGANPIVVVGPNGVGKSRLMRSVIGAERFVSAQRRTYLEEQIPGYAAEQAKNEQRSQLARAHNEPWQFSNEIDAMFAHLLREHYSALYSNNEAAKTGVATAKPFISDTILDRLSRFWQSVYVNRKLSFADMSPRVERTDSAGQQPYAAKAMSDGERACLYMAARVLTADAGLLAIDEPELHLHRKLAIDYWNKLEAMRPDIRFVYVTHDIHFALSRREPEFLVVRDEGTIEKAVIESLPPALVDALVGAATLTINANRIIFFEGVSGKGLAHKLFKAWITGARSAALGVGSRNAVLEAGRAFSSLGIISNAQVISVVDRDHGPDDWLSSLQAPAYVLPLHEVESLFALPSVLRAIGGHVGYPNGDPWQAFLARARSELDGGMPKAVSERVRARISTLLAGVFTSNQVKATVSETESAHTLALTSTNWSTAVPALFVEEEKRIRDAMAKDGHSILVVYSGKQALNDAARVLGMTRDTYASIVIDAIEKKDHPLRETVTAELGKFLPPRE